MTSPIMRPGGGGPPRASPLQPPPAPAKAAPPGRPSWLDRVYPPNLAGIAAVLACAALAGLALQQSTLVMPEQLAPVAEAYRLASIALVALWAAPGVVLHLVRRREAAAAGLALCAGAFLALQALVPPGLTELTSALPPRIPAEAYITATPTPAPTATPLAAELIGIAQVDALQVRTGPGLRYPPFTRISHGDMLRVTGRDERAEWVHVEFPDGRDGWCAREYMALLGPGGRPSEPWGLPVLPPP